MVTGVERVTVLLAAGGAAWEAEVLRRLADAGPGLVLLRRCLDVADLLATAATGQGRVAVVAAGLPEVDADAVARLRRDGVAVVAVAESGDDGDREAARATALDVGAVLRADALDQLPRLLVAAGRSFGGGDGWSASAYPGHSAETEAGTTADAGDLDPSPAPGAPGGLVAVWGPAGAPGRTTLSMALSAELASRRRSTVLVDVDPYGGAIAQQLGVLDETSGLLAAARLANAGTLGPRGLADVLRAVAPDLRVLTGLPRADRWSEVRPAAFDEVLASLRNVGELVVADTGFCLEGEAHVAFGSGAPERNGMTLATLEAADEVVVVGSADPVGLARLARGLVELVDAVPGVRLRVVVNRMRGGLGWRQDEIRLMLADFVSTDGVHFLPEDRATCDRALVLGRSPVELGDSPLRRGVAELADALTGCAGQSLPRRRGWFRRRTAGTAR